MRLTRRAVLKLVPSGVAAALLAACRQQAALLPTPSATPPAESPEPIARTFLSAWQADDFDTMYALLDDESQARITRDDFEQTYRQIFDEATIYAFETTLVAAGRVDATTAAADFDAVYRTRLVGDLVVRPRLPMTLVGETWRIRWTPATIIPQLGEGNVLRLFKRTSTRGVIYDRQRNILATQGAIVVVGVVPGRIQDEPTMLNVLSALLNKAPADIAALYANQPPDWFIPVGRIAFETFQEQYDTLAAIPGLDFREQAARSYPQGSTAAHVLGYVGPISREELAALGERGYEEDDIVGKMGLEKAAEEWLAGKKGGRLAVLTPEGQEVATLADVPAQQSLSLHTSLDVELQQVAEAVLDGKRGSVVVLDVKTGRVLALASAPTFDPNAMSNLLDLQQRLAFINRADQPLLNRATQGAYPPGSVFKIVSMATALQEGLFATTSTFNCPGYWDRLGIRMNCWKSSGHGTIDLSNGLVESCDVVFYEVGLAAYNRDPNLLQTYARRFGLGALTGVELDESAGLVPDNEWKVSVQGVGWTPGDSVNMAIGQGFLLTTPLQIARMMAAIANGGTLYRPQIIVSAEDPTGERPPLTFEPQVDGTLDLAPEHLQAIRDALLRVTQPPRGTASHIFRDFPVPVAGKTGTAEAPGVAPHAWFAAYAPAPTPEIAVVAMAENAGEGSGVAAPMVREVLAHYFGVAAQG
ncbi:MAG: penicillin-binding protein 2 [Ardenticatenia bacterium]|nr:MAG: penicillin-binding protein 2 [Ardenticatenia bacterium]